VVCAFASDEVVHVDDSVDPVRDLETIQVCLCYQHVITVKHDMLQWLHAVLLRVGVCHLVQASKIDIEDSIVSCCCTCFV
jgi:hypothetical protein